MKLNDKELAYFAETANGRADKEGILWIKENDGKLKKKGGLLTERTQPRRPNLSQHSSCAKGTDYECFLCFLPVHNRRWFKLIGNLLFYLKSEVPVSCLWSRLRLYNWSTSRSPGTGDIIYHYFSVPLGVSRATLSTIELVAVQLACPSFYTSTHSTYEI